MNSERSISTDEFLQLADLRCPFRKGVCTRHCDNFNVVKSTNTLVVSKALSSAKKRRAEVTKSQLNNYLNLAYEILKKYRQVDEKNKCKPITPKNN